MSVTSESIPFSTRGSFLTDKTIPQQTPDLTTVSPNAGLFSNYQKEAEVAKRHPHSGSLRSDHSGNA